MNHMWSGLFFQEVLGTILLLTSEVTSEQQIVKKMLCGNER